MKSHAFCSLVAALLVAAISCTEISGPSGPPGSRCNRGTLTVGGAVSGTLASGACTATGATAETYLDYTTTVTAGERYLFTLRSDEPWPPLLMVINPADTATGTWTGWSDGIVGTGGHSQLLFVSPYSGPVTLRVASGLATHPGAYTLRSSQCGGSSVAIGASTVSLDGSITADDCVIHDRFIPADSTHADTYILDFHGDGPKSVTIKARGNSVGNFHPAFVLTGPFVAGSSALARQYTVSSADSLSVPVGGSPWVGKYLLAVAAASPEMTGDYTLTVAPASP